MQQDCCETLPGTVSFISNLQINALLFIAPSAAGKVVLVTF